MKSAVVVFQKSVFHVLLASMAILMAACASGDKNEPCPTETEEPVSVCRAKEKCRLQRGSVGLGMGVRFGARQPGSFSL